LASRASLSQTALICWNSSSYMTICGCIRSRPRSPSVTRVCRR
jgi:hypothetical protein